MHVVSGCFVIFPGSVVIFYILVVFMMRSFYLMGSLAFCEYTHIT